MTQEAIILAGGLGTRLRSVVSDRPKALADIAGRPFLAWQLDYLRTQGVTRVVLSLGHLADLIVNRFGSRYADVDLEYAIEDKPLGTGGAIRFALTLCQSDSVFVVNGDTLAPVSLPHLIGDDRDELLVMAALRCADISRYGGLQIEDHRVIAFREKACQGQGFINAGVYWIRRDIFAGRELPQAFSFERDFLQAFTAQIRPRAVVFDVPFIDIGLPETLAAAQNEVPAMVATCELRASRISPR